MLFFNSAKFVKKFLPIRGFFSISEEVSEALHTGKGVVALESTVITHGLPYPRNLEVGRKLENVVRDSGAIPATIAVLNGKIVVGLTAEQLSTLALPATKAKKCSTRELSSCLVEKAVGSTTVAATSWIAKKVGINVFATGGIGGVHRDAENTFDISADMTELGRTPICVVCAGVKSILDIQKTLEYMETLGITVIVHGKDRQFPGFFSPRTQYKGPYFTDSIDKIVKIMKTHFVLMKFPSSIVVASQRNEDTVNAKEIEFYIEKSLEKAKKMKIQGKDLTPFLLTNVSELSGSASTDLNVKLLEHNVKVASQLSNSYARCMREHKEDLGNSENSIVTFFSDNNPYKKRVVCIGASIVDFEVFIDDENINDVFSSNKSAGYSSAKILQKPGGVARNHCDALSRLGFDVPLISILSDDPISEYLLKNAEHMNLKDVHKINGIEGPSSITIISRRNGKVLGGFISVDHIMEKFTPEIIYDKSNLISEAEYVILDANLSIEAIQAVLRICAGKRVWFEPTNALKISKIFKSKNLFENISILSPNFHELKAICHYLKLDDKIPENLVAASQNNELCESIIIPPALFPDNLDYLLVTMDKYGVALIKKSNKDDSSANLTMKSGHEVIFMPPAVDSDSIVSASGAGDCFNGGFLAAKLFGLLDGECVEFASACAAESLRSSNPVPKSLNIHRNRLQEMFNRKKLKL